MAEKRVRTNNNKEQEEGIAIVSGGQKATVESSPGLPKEGSRNVSRELAPPIRLPWYGCREDQRSGADQHPKRLHASVVAYLVVSVSRLFGPRPLGTLCGSP